MPFAFPRHRSGVLKGSSRSQLRGQPRLAVFPLSFATGRRRRTSKAARLRSACGAVNRGAADGLGNKLTQSVLRGVLARFFQVSCAAVCKVKREAGSSPVLPPQRYANVRDRPANRLGRLISAADSSHRKPGDRPGSPVWQPAVGGNASESGPADLLVLRSFLSIAL